MPINATIPMSGEQQPSFNQNMAGAMTLNEMAQKKQINDIVIQEVLQQKQAQQQAQAQQQQKHGLLQQAYQNSIGEDGQFDRKKFLPQAYKIDYNLGQQAEKEFNTMDKAQADIQNLHDTHNTTMQDLIKKQNEVKKYQDEEIAATNKTLAQFGNSYLTEKDPQKKELFKNYLQKTIAPTLAYKNDKGEYVANGFQLPEDPAQFDAAISQYVNANSDIVKQSLEERKQTETERSNKADEATAKINAETNKINASKNTAPKTPATGKPMSETGAKTLGLISTGVQGAQTFLDALNKGDANFWTTSLLGGFTNPEANIAFDKATEALGRLNSGGAINKDEEKRFGRLIADKKKLLTPEGRKAISAELGKFIDRGKSTGNLIYGGKDWQDEFGVNIKSNQTDTSFDDLWTKHGGK